MRTLRRHPNPSRGLQTNIIVTTEQSNHDKEPCGTGWKQQVGDNFTISRFVHRGLHQLENLRRMMALSLFKRRWIGY